MSDREEVQTPAMHTQVVAQWIISLAISVICCSVLFVVFAGYIVDLHETTAFSSVRIELLKERDIQLSNELDALRRQLSLPMNLSGRQTGATPDAIPQTQPQGVVEGAAPSAQQAPPTDVPPLALPQDARKP